MSELSVRSPLAPSSIAIAAAVLIALAWLTAGVSGHILRPLLDIEAISGIPFVRWGFVMLGNTIVMLALTSFAARTRPGALLGLAGLGASPWRQAPPGAPSGR